MSRGRSGVLGACLAVALGATACTADDQPAPGPVTRAPTVTATTEVPVSPGDDSALPLVDSPADWRVVSTGDIDGAIIPLYDGELLVTSEAHGAGGRDLTVVRSDSGDLVFSYDPPAGSIVETAWLSGPWLVIEEVPYDPVDFSGRILRVQLATGETQEVVSATAAARMTSPEMEISGDVLIYIGAAPGGGECLVQVSIATLQSSGRFCAPPEEYLGDPFLTSDGTVTFSTLAGSDSSAPQGCKSLYVLRPADATPTAVPATVACSEWSGITLGGAVLWSETLPDATISESDGFIRFADGSVAGLGTVLTDTFRACGDAVFWIAFRDDRSSEPQQIRRWTPNDDFAEVIFAAESVDEMPSYITCGNNEVAVSSVTHFAPDGTTSIALQGR